MHVCVHTGTHTCVHACMSTIILVHNKILLNASLSVWLYVRVRTFVHACARVHIQA